MSYDVGEWVELTRSVQGELAGSRGRVTSTGTGEEVDIALERGSQITGVSTEAVRHAAGPRSSGGALGCSVMGLAVVSAAGLTAARAAGWWA